MAGLSANLADVNAKIAGYQQGLGQQVYVTTICLRWPAMLVANTYCLCLCLLRERQMQMAGCNRICSGRREITAISRRAVALTLLMDLILAL